VRGRGSAVSRPIYSMIHLHLNVLLLLLSPLAKRPIGRHAVTESGHADVQLNERCSSQALFGCDFVAMVVACFQLN